MKIVIINKSDSTGGAAVVSFRMMSALREAGHDAHMIVAEKLTDSPYVALAAPEWRIKIPFLKERLGIALKNNFDRSTLFKIDTASDGLPLWRHPWVKEADAVILNWVNQGLLSLKGVERICSLGKPVAWVMHDMWCFTGICHHAAACDNYLKICHSCPLLPYSSSSLSIKIQARKLKLYKANNIRFVAVSRWLADKAASSLLLSKESVTVIPNAFPVGEYIPRKERGADAPIKILFGAARLDDPIKGLPVLIKMTRYLADRHPEIAHRLRLVTFGEAKNPESLSGIAIPAEHRGRIVGAENLKRLYEECDIVVSTSDYETLPGTLVEGQAYGCVPVSFHRGGQADIIDHLHTGYLAAWSDDISKRAAAIAEGVLWAATQGEETRRRMYASVKDKFSYPAVASAILSLLRR